MNIQCRSAQSQAIFANHCGTQFLVDNLVKKISACKDAPKKSSPASSKLRPHHQIGLEKATQAAFQTALVECIMKTVLSSASPAKDVVYFVQHGLTPMFTRFTTALAKAIAHLQPHQIMTWSRQSMKSVRSKLYSRILCKYWVRCTVHDAHQL